MARTRGRGRSEVVTLIYVPGPSATIRRFQFRRVWIWRAVVAVLLGILGTAVLGTRYVQVSTEVAELEHLRQQTRMQRVQLLEYSDEIESIADKLGEVSRLDRKLRVITNLDPSDPLPLPGIGGVEGDLLGAQLLTGLTRERRHRRMMESLGRLSEAAEIQEKSLSALIHHLEDQTARLVTTPSIVPSKGWVTSAFGYRTSPFTGNREFHRGVDIAARQNTPIVAPADGEVRFVGQQRALGNTIIIQHGYGVETIYGHLSEFFVDRGEKVRRGQRIGLMGTTGRSTGPHLHYQVEVNSVPVNPRNYMLD